MALVPVGKVTVRPATATISVNITGGDVTAYTSQAASATHTLPKSITTNTDFWLGVGQYLVTCSMAGVTIDSQLITIQPGSAPTIDPAVDSFTETASVLAQYAALTGSTFTGEITATDFSASGKTGATGSAAILAGGTTSGAPLTGAHVVGEVVVDATGTIWVCTVAGTPGTWVANGSGVELGFAAATADQTFTSGTIANVTSLSVTFTVGSRPVYVHAHLEVGLIATSGKYLQWAVTDNAGTVKADSYASAGFAGATVQSDAWERIATPGTYTRKVMAGSSNTFSSTVYGATYPGSFLRVITA